MNVEPDAWDSQREALVGYTKAAMILRRSDDDAIKRLVNKNALEAAVAQQFAPHGPGRTSVRFVRLRDVRALRAAELARADAVEASVAASVAEERDELEARLAELEAAMSQAQGTTRQPQVPPPVATSDPEDLVRLERSNFELSQRVAALHAALRRANQAARHLNTQIAEGTKANEQLLETTDGLLGHASGWTDLVPLQ